MRKYVNTDSEGGCQASLLTITPGVAVRAGEMLEFVEYLPLQLSSFHYLYYTETQDVLRALIKICRKLNI